MRIKEIFETYTNFTEKELERVFQIVNESKINIPESGEQVKHKLRMYDGMKSDLTEFCLYLNFERTDAQNRLVKMKDKYKRDHNIWKDEDAIAHMKANSEIYSELENKFNNNKFIYEYLDKLAWIFKSKIDVSLKLVDTSI